MQIERKRRSEFILYVSRYLSVLVLLFCVVAIAKAGQPRKATVTKVVDGDTIQVLYQGRSIRVRLWGIDTPEWRQPFSKSAKKFTAKLVAGTEVELEEKDWDDYGRLVAIVTTKKNSV